MSGFLRNHPALSAVIAAVVLVLVFASFPIVPETKEVVVVRFGKPVSVLNQYQSGRPIGAAGAAVFVVIAVGGLLYTSLIQRDYEKIYLPAALFLKHTAQPSDLILGGSELGFALGFDSNIVDDNSFTYVTHKAPVFIAMSNNYKQFLRGYRMKGQPKASYFDRLLAEKYVRVYSNPGYDIFEERSRVNARE